MFIGSVVALITPFNNKGKICISSLKKLINYHIVNGTTSIVLISTTGESISLNYNERHYIVMNALEISDGHIPIIAGISSNSTVEAINLIKNFNNSGVVGYLVVTPYYNIPTQKGIFQHFKTIAEHTELPQILYNVPARTGCDISPETLRQLANIKNIVGIKDATGNLNNVRQFKNMVSDNFILISGHDATALDFIKLGGNGVISVTANIAAQDMSNMCRLAIAGKYQEAEVINKRLMPLHTKLFIESNPIPVKWACKKLELIKSSVLRLPLTKITTKNSKLVTSAMKYAGLF